MGAVLYDASSLEETRRKSLVEAMRNAVERVVGVQVPAKTMVSKAVLIDSKILIRSRGYVRKYDVLRRWKEGPFYKTKIRALVAAQDLANDLTAAGILGEPQVGNPRVSVLLTETVPGSTVPISVAADALVAALIAKGFRAVDRAELASAQGVSVLNEVAHGDTRRVAPLGNKLDAEILIFGSVTGSKIGNKALGGLISIRAVLAAKAYKSQTREVLASVEEVASGLDATERAAAMKAFALAGQEAGGFMGPEILGALRRRAYASVVVEGLKNIGQIKKIEDALSRFPGVGEVYLRSYADGLARIDVGISGVSTQELAAVLEKVSGLGLRVRGMTDQTVEALIQ